MDVHVINVEDESDHQAADDRDAETSDGEINNAESSSETQNPHPRKHFSSVGRTMPETYQGVGLVPSGVMYVSTDGNHISNQNTCAVLNIHASTAADPSHPVKNATLMNYTARPPSQNRTLGKDGHNLLEYFKKMQGENPGFFYAIQLDEDNHMSNVFWADTRSRTAYSHFGDAVHLDTTCTVNQYSVPFAPFTGVNNHGQLVLFGCALLFDDSEASFLWLFKTFLTAMNEQQPVSIITDQDIAIQAAVSQVFPQARHCINKWHVLREGQEKLAHVCLAHPNFQGELYNCINRTETIEEFESSWNSILDKYELRRNDWLQSLYNARAQWVPAYFHDSFFAAISPNQGFGGSFFEGFVNQQMTLPLFFRQYERALESWIEKEIEADYETICTTPVLKTPSPMEKQAANLYTRKVFLKFQDELVETFVYTANIIEGDDVNSTFKVAKFEDVDKAYTVAFNHAELRANCSCQMFEYSGILCRHILTVFTMSNVLTLPSHYILKRWTKNAKSSAGSDECTGELHGKESLTSRYSNLCREAIRYAEEGAVTVETYNVAVTGLKEGGKKVTAMKKSVAKATPPNNQASGTNNNKKTTTSSTSDLTPLLWPRQDEISGRFNLNDSGGPVQSVADLNLPRMTPVSVHRDGGPSGNMVVLPCLKAMTWVMENKNSSLGNKVAVINLKLQDYSRTPSTEFEVKFQLSKVSLEPMLKSMASISEQLSRPANKIAVINLNNLGWAPYSTRTKSACKVMEVVGFTSGCGASMAALCRDGGGAFGTEGLQDADTNLGESEVKFQVSKDTLGAMLRSMAYIREQLSHVVSMRIIVCDKYALQLIHLGDAHSEPLLKKHRK
ncbi:hypothetical protein TSUD_403910 [Trifolium subterraneum]|uniref:Protein FAR1-RELATED SEQUENCE n=1 Tax=Trifolium subterraneum TaxID=3900 RepID=A0A2Z6NT93_TRISU|nr:hypothetical protein TSUD_403910 [Trifolium subterraneum]